jgi:hypothetical protein
MLGLNNFFFRNGRLLIVFRLFRGFLRRRLRRLLRETETCPKEKACGETQKTMRTLHGRQRSFLNLQETKIATCGIVCESADIVNRFGMLLAEPLASRFLLQRLKSQLECGAQRKFVPPRSAECDVLVGPPPFHYFSLPRWL